MFSEDREAPPTDGVHDVSSQPERRRWISPEEYLELERRAHTKSQYLDGEILAMTGASRPHNLIVGKLIRRLGNHLSSGPCEVYPSDMRVRVRESGLYTYPDVTVVCGTPELEDAHGDTLLNPTLLIEVLSPSTEAADRGWKGDHYRPIASLQEYLIVWQDEARVLHHRRQGDREWLLTEAEGLDARVALAAIGMELPLSQIFERVL